MSTPESTPTATPADCSACSQPARDRLSLLIVPVAILGIGLISAVAIWGAWEEKTQRLETVRYVFGSVLPLLGTWVGTVLVYYFSRENFQAASQETRLLVKAAIGDKLRKVTVREAMISRDRMIVHPDAWTTEQDIKILQLRELCKGLVTRVPILDAQGKARYVVHSSTLDAFITAKTLEASKSTPPQPVDLAQCTLADLLANAELKRKIADGMAFVAVGGTLADAKERMEAKGTHCQDVFVTSGGTQDEPVMGWITNIDLSRHANA